MMQCPVCGYIMDEFTEECPRCQRLGLSSSAQISLKEQQHRLAVMDIVKAKQQRRQTVQKKQGPLQRYQRKHLYAITSMEILALVVLGLGVFLGGGAITVGFVGAKDNERIFPIVYGLAILFLSFILHVMFSWGADMLRTLGDIESTLHQPQQDKNVPVD
jgi:hypothetical protein